MAEIRVHDLKLAECGRWSFRDAALRWNAGGGFVSAEFDPFPAYAHHKPAAELAASEARRKCPPLWDVDVYVADREEKARSNGYSDVRTDTYKDGGYVRDPRGLILMSGKRIPPHPAVTRYLVAHEYGHNVAFMLNSLRPDTRSVSSTEALERDYATARGLPESTLHNGDGGTWHDSCGEIMACDFRILVLSVEAEFWPHPGIKRPEGIPAIRDWWTAAMAALGEARSKVTVTAEAA